MCVWERGDYLCPKWPHTIRPTTACMEHKRLFSVGRSNSFTLMFFKIFNMVLWSYWHGDSGMQSHREEIGKSFLFETGVSIFPLSNPNGRKYVSIIWSFLFWVLDLWKYIHNNTFKVWKLQINIFIITIWKFRSID